MSDPFTLQSNAKHGKTVDVETPTDEEIERIAMRMHKNGKPCLETILGSKVFYRPRRTFSHSSRSVNPFTGEQGEESVPTITDRPAEFTFGYNAPRHIVLSWNAGDDKPPAWFRYEDKLVDSPKGEHMVNQRLCELISDIPPGVKLHIWKPHANYRCAGGSHWHGKVKLLERPYYLQLYWRRLAVSSEQAQPLGVFRLDLNGLLGGGYIRSEKADRHGAACVRLRIFRADDDGRFYLQTKEGKPKLFIASSSMALQETQEPPIDLPEPPSRYEARISRIIRDTPLARDLKNRYGFACQVSGCDFRIEPTSNFFYIEVHHVRPLGGDHDGTDSHANMLVLCPNHHAMFDYGIPRFLSPHRIEILGVMHDLIIKHELSSDSIEYHNTKLQNRNC